MGGGNHGQVAMEYMMIFGFSVALAIPLIFLFISQSQYLQADVSQSQLEKAAYELVAAAKEVYYLGPPTQKTIEVSFPKGITDITFFQSYIEFTIALGDQTYVYTKDFPMNITGSLPTFSGPHYIVVQSTSNAVNITER